MKKQIIAIAIASALGISAGAFAQQASSQGKEMEAVVMVTKIDPASKTAQVRTKRGDLFTVALPADANMDNIKEGSRYKVRYHQAVATSIEPGAQEAAAGATREAQRGAKAGEGTVTGMQSGVIQSIDPANRQIALRTMKGDTETFALGSGVSPESLKQGEAVTVTYQRAVATRMASTPQPITDPAPAY